MVNAAGCGSGMKEYGHLLRDDPEYAERAARSARRSATSPSSCTSWGPWRPRHPLRCVAYHDACHLAHAQGIRAQPRAVLRGIPGLELAEIPEAEICCGGAGIYNLVSRSRPSELGERKAANVPRRAPTLVTANPGCLLQIRRYLGAGRYRCSTPSQLLDASIRGVDARRDSPSPASSRRPDERVREPCMSRSSTP